MQCTDCHKQCIFKCRPKEDEIFGAPCDSCSKPYCKNCAKLTTTEAHAVSLTQRCLIFYCGDCKSIIKDSQKFKLLLNKYDRLKAENVERDLQIEMLEEKCNDITLELQAELTKLTVDNKAKEDHIKRLKRGTQDFEDTVFMAERDFEKKIDNQREEIANLNRKIIQLIDINESLTSEIAVIQSENRKLEQNFKELEVIKNNMLSSIEVLTGERDSYIASLKETKLELFDLKQTTSSVRCDDEDHSNTSVCANDSVKSGDNVELQTCRNLRRNRLLLLGDQLCYHVAATMRRKLEQFNIEIIIKPGALYRDVIRDIANLAKDYTSDDFIIIIAGINNVRNKKTISISDIHEKMNMCSHTNILFASLPYHGKNHALDKFAYDLNVKLCNYLYKMNGYCANKFSFVDCNSEGSVFERNYIVDTLIANLSKKSVHFTNLRFVELTAHHGPVNSDICDVQDVFPTNLGMDRSLLCDESDSFLDKSVVSLQCP